MSGVIGWGETLTPEEKFRLLEVDAAIYQKSAREKTDEINSLVDTLADLNDACGVLRDQKQALETDNNCLRDKVIELTRCDCAKQTIAIKDQDNRIREFERALGEEQALVDILKLRIATLENSGNTLAHISRIQDLGSEVIALQSELERANSHIQALTDSIDAWATGNQEKNDLIVALEARVTEYSDTIEILRNELAKNHTSEPLEKTRAMLVNRFERIQELEAESRKQRSSIIDQHDKVVGLITENDKLSKLLTEKSGRVVILRREINSKDEVVHSQANRIAELEDFTQGESRRVREDGVTIVKLRTEMVRMCEDKNAAIMEQGRKIVDLKCELAKKPTGPLAGSKVQSRINHLESEIRLLKSMIVAKDGLIAHLEFSLQEAENPKPGEADVVSGRYWKQQLDRINEKRRDEKVKMVRLENRCERLLDQLDMYTGMDGCGGSD